MLVAAECTPSNSVVFLCGNREDVREWPDWDDQQNLVAATSDGILVGTSISCDGPTTVVLTDDSHIVAGAWIAWEGILPTPRGTVEASTCEGDVIGVLSVHHDRTIVRVWLNDDQWPDRVVFQCLPPAPSSG
jgi:hypothetical protein